MDLWNAYFQVYALILPCGLLKELTSVFSEWLEKAHCT